MRRDGSNTVLELTRQKESYTQASRNYSRSLTAKSLKAGVSILSLITASASKRVIFIILPVVRGDDIDSTMQFGPTLPSMSCVQPASQNSLCVGDTANLWLAQIICLKALFNVQYFNSQMTHLEHCLAIITAWVITFKSAWIFTSLSSKLLSPSRLPNSTSNWEKS